MSNEIFLITPYNNFYAEKSEDFLRKNRKYLTYNDVDNNLNNIWYIVNDELKYFVIKKKETYFNTSVSSNNSTDGKFHIEKKFTKLTSNRIKNTITEGLYVVKAKSFSKMSGYNIEVDKLYIYYYDGNPNGKSKYKLYVNGEIYEHDFNLESFNDVFEVLYKLDNSKKDKLMNCNKFNVSRNNNIYKISIPYSPYSNSLFYNLRNINNGVSFHSNVKFIKSGNQNFLQIVLNNSNKSLVNRKIKKPNETSIIIEENNGKMNNTTFISILESIKNNQTQKLVQAIKKYKKILEQINQSKSIKNLHDIQNKININNKKISIAITNLINKKKSNKISEWANEEAAAPKAKKEANVKRIDEEKKKSFMRANNIYTEKTAAAANAKTELNGLPAWLEPYHPYFKAIYPRLKEKINSNITEENFINTYINYSNNNLYHNDLKYLNHNPDIKKFYKNILVKKQSIKSKTFFTPDLINHEYEAYIANKNVKEEKENEEIQMEKNIENRIRWGKNILRLNENEEKFFYTLNNSRYELTVNKVKEMFAAAEQKKANEKAATNVKTEEEAAAAAAAANANTTVIEPKNNKSWISKLNKNQKKYYNSLINKNINENNFMKKYKAAKKIGYFTSTSKAAAKNKAEKEAKKKANEEAAEAAAKNKAEKEAKKKAEEEAAAKRIANKKAAKNKVVKKIQQQGETNKLQQTKKRNANSVKQALSQQLGNSKVTKKNLNNTDINNTELYKIYSNAYNKLMLKIK